MAARDVDGNAELLWKKALAGEVHWLRRFLVGEGQGTTELLNHYCRSRWGGIIQTALYAAAKRENMSLDHITRYGPFLVDAAAFRPSNTWDFNHLHMAVLSGDVGTVRKLLGYGVDVCARFDTPFWEGPAVLLVLGEQPEDPQYTIKKWHIDLIELFLDNGADVNSSPCLKDGAINLEEPILRLGTLPWLTCDGRQKIQQAVRFESLELVKLLVSRGARLDDDLVGDAMWLNQSRDLTDYLVREHGLYGVITNEVWERAMVHAGPRRAQRFCRLLESQGRGDAPCPRNALWRECLELCDEDVVAALLDRVAEVNGRSGNGWTALYATVSVSTHSTRFLARENNKRSYLAVIRMLLDRGADPNISCCFGSVKGNLLVDTALHRCIHNYDRKMSTAVIKMLLDSGADPNARDSLGRTPLLLISRSLRDNFKWLDKERVATARDLLDAGADVNARDNNGAMALSSLLAQAPSANVLIITAMIAWRGAREDDVYRRVEPIDRWIIKGSLRAVVRWRFWVTDGLEERPMVGVLRRIDRRARYEFKDDEKAELEKRGNLWKKRVDISALVASYYSFAVARSKAWRTQGAAAGNGGRGGAAAIPRS